MGQDAREAEKKRRRAEALRANLKRRKAGRGGHAAPADREGEDTEVSSPDADSKGT